MHNFNGMGLGWIIVAIFLITFIWLVIKVSTQNYYNRRIGKSALDILKERYAAGEINKAEFEEKKKDLL